MPSQRKIDAQAKAAQKQAAKANGGPAPVTRYAAKEAMWKAQAKAER